MNKLRISVVGGGSWGTTLSILLASKGFDLKLWVYENDLKEEIEKFRENKRFLPGIQLPQNIKVVADFKSSAEADVLVFAVPTQHLRGIVKNYKGLLGEETIVVSASKGIEEKSLQTPSRVIEEELNTKQLAVLSGPNLSKEIALGLPAATVLASKSSRIAELLQEVFLTERFRVYRSQDVIGVELGGSLKNVIALAAGIADGLNLGDNARAALMVRGMSEIERLGLALGGKSETFSGLSGIGDLIVTCSSRLSRNHQVGMELAKGKSLSDILKNMVEVAEGVPTTRAAYELKDRHKIEMPIVTEVYQVLFEKKSHLQDITDLMSRKLKEEGC